jgi:hypothetical protein
MITKVGRDSFGKDTMENYVGLGISAAGILQTSDAASGMAMINVDSAGANSIVVVSGANNLLTPDEVSSFTDLISSSRVLVCQCEILEASTLAALQIASRAGVLTVMNSAPAPASLNPEVYSLSDVFCANETEAETLTGTFKPITSWLSWPSCSSMWHAQTFDRRPLTCTPLFAFRRPRRRYDGSRSGCSGTVGSWLSHRCADPRGRWRVHRHSDLGQPRACTQSCACRGHGRRGRCIRWCVGAVPGPSHCCED